MIADWLQEGGEEFSAVTHAAPAWEGGAAPSDAYGRRLGKGISCFIWKPPIQDTELAISQSVLSDAVSCCVTQKRTICLSPRVSVSMAPPVVADGV